MAKKNPFAVMDGASTPPNKALKPPVAGAGKGSKGLAAKMFGKIKGKGTTGKAPPFGS